VIRRHTPSGDGHNVQTKRRRTRPLRVALALWALSVPAAACTNGSVTSTSAATTSTTGAVTASITTAVVADTVPALLIDHRDEPEPPPRASRSRLVEVDLGVLLDDESRPRGLEAFRLDLFDDVSYRAVIDGISDKGGVITWTGTLEGIEYSSFTMVHTASTFAANFASPQGVFEVTSVEDGVYRVTQVDQSQMPTEEL
jgi:hypothetical protein